MNALKKLVLVFSMIIFGLSHLQVVADSNTTSVIDDSVITTKVKAKMVADKAVAARNIGVETKDGMVSLSGNVDTDSEANTAIELAISTEGVKDVDVSKLSVKTSNHPITDSVITAKVKGVFVREKLFGNEPIIVTSIHVETKDGVVFLTGTVDNSVQSENAQKLAKSVNGVIRVESSVKIKE